MQCADTGIGMAEEMLPYVFDLFVQSDTSYSRDRGGLGIGLALVKRMAELHGGRVEAASDGVGKGSAFTLRLPLLKHGAAAHLARQAGGHGEPPAGPLRILVVDDNRDGSTTLSILLKRLGHDVQVCETGDGALEVLKSSPVDVGILDIGLPGMDGCELAQRIRMMPQMASATLIALTGYSQESDTKRFREAGFNEHLIKPAAIDTLKNVLAGIMKRDS